MHYLLIYEVARDYSTRRSAWRGEHLAHARAAVARGELVLGGAFDTLDGAVLLFQGASPEVAERFARADPYVREGVVTSWRVRGWTTVVGNEARTRVDDVGLAPRTREEATPARVAAFLRRARHWTVSTLGEHGPHAAVVGVAVADDLSCVFDTLATTRKALDVGRDPRVALVMWVGEATAQLEGTAEIVAAGTPAQAMYLGAFPAGHERTTDPDLIYVRVRPTWIRISDFGGPAPAVVELALA